jgi:tRNA (mo5U34)-methyltransferase
MTQKELDKLNWWHTIEFPDGTVTKGKNDYRKQTTSRYLLPENLEGKSVIDFGTWDGFFAIQAKKRGASRVLAVDRWLPMLKTAELSLGAYGIEYRWSEDLDFPLAQGLIEEEFDVVLFYGILYHLKNPYMGLLNAYKCCKKGGLFIIESAIEEGKASQLPDNVPALWIIDVVHHGDPSNYYMPNEAGLRQLCKLAGFNPTKKKYLDGTRLTIHCTK